MSEPYSSPTDFHRHKCKFCAFVWEHHDTNDVIHGDYGAHECPACHRCNWSLGIYKGPDAPAIRNGKVLADYAHILIHPDQLGDKP